MKVKHTLPCGLLNRTIEIVMVGAGGTGSALLPRLMQLHQAMLALGHPHGIHVTVYDDDHVSHANIGRQAFFPCDVGQRKATVLVNRLNMCWGTAWSAVPTRVDDSTAFKADIVIGCVDTRKARLAITKAVRADVCYYIDSGNSENTGQVVLGELCKGEWTRDAIRLPTANDLFPEMFDPTLDATDDKPSCSLPEALAKQSLVINMAMATEIFNLLWMLLRTGTLKYSGKFVNLETGTSVPIKMDTKTWERMGYVCPIPQAEVA